MRYAIYRCLYGEDFIQQSIKSIDDYVDKIFVFWDDTPWANATGVKWKGNYVVFPKKFDNILDKIRALKNPKIILKRDHQFNNNNQFTHFVNNLILPNYERPDEIMVPEVDHIWRRDQLESAIQSFKESGATHAATSQHELWRTYEFKVPRNRFGTVFWNMNKVKKLPKTGRQANAPGGIQLGEFNHNFGFCISREVMYWKHLTALAFSRGIGDAVPNPNWYERKWLTWDFKKNNKDVEISLGREHRIPRIERYKDKVPEIMWLEMPDYMRRRMNIPEKGFKERAEFWGKHQLLFSSTFPEKVLKYFKDKRILEIGPGNGKQYEQIKNMVKEYTIADISQKILDKNIYDKVDKHRIENTKYADNFNKKFDVISFWYVIHHVLKPDVYSFIDFLKRHLVDNGILVFNYPSVLAKDRYFDKCKNIGDGMKTTFYDEGVIKRIFEKDFNILEDEKLHKLNHRLMVCQKK
jgi:2-polyprenyl-3-methyl-5-hydroxy-6-metoxy-1,4-benzoquinol methylase